MTILKWRLFAAFFGGFVGFIIGFVGPMIFYESNQGPMVGFVTGPLVFLAGALVGYFIGLSKEQKKRRDMIQGFEVIRRVEPDGEEKNRDKEKNRDSRQFIK